MPEPERDATAEEQAAVRRLLAGARHDGPVPVDVAARLDAVLAQLASDEPVGATQPPGEGAEVVELAARRRGRARALLVAAAAVVVVAVGVGQVAGPQDGGDTTAADRSVGAARGEAESEAGGANDTQSGEAPEASGAPSTQTEDSAPPALSDQPPAEAALVRILPRTFARDVRSLQDATGLQVSQLDSRVPAAELSTAPAFVCATASWGAGELFAVIYAGNPAVLAYRPATGDTQSVDVVQCGTGVVVRSTTLPLP